MVLEEQTSFNDSNANKLLRVAYGEKFEIDIYGLHIKVIEIKDRKLIKSVVCVCDAEGEE